MFLERASLVSDDGKLRSNVKNTFRLGKCSAIKRGQLLNKVKRGAGKLKNERKNKVQAPK